MGQPDIIVKMTEPYTIRAERPDVFRCFVVPLNIPAGKYVRAVDYPPEQPQDHRTTRCCSWITPARRGSWTRPTRARVYAASGGVGFLPSGGMGGWAPGAAPHRFPDGAAKAVAPHTDLVIQTHFHPSGKVETEQSSVGIYLTDEAAGSVRWRRCRWAARPTSTSRRA